MTVLALLLDDAEDWSEYRFVGESDLLERGLFPATVGEDLSIEGTWKRRGVAGAVPGVLDDGGGSVMSRSRVGLAPEDPTLP